MAENNTNISNERRVWDKSTWGKGQENLQNMLNGMEDDIEAGGGGGGSGVSSVNGLKGAVVIDAKNLHLDESAQSKTTLQAALNEKQHTLTAGTNITISNNVISSTATGEPNEYIKNAVKSSDETSLTLTKKDNTTVTFKPGCYAPFPSSFVTNSTTQAFGQSVVGYSGFKAGMAWYGELTCTDLPNNLVNVECTVKAMTNSIAVIELSSSNREPYHWEYNTASFNDSTHSAWKLVPCLRETDCPSAAGVDHDVYVSKKSNGAMEFKTKKSLTAGTNITIDADRKINAVDTTYTAGSGIAISDSHVISTTGQGKNWYEISLTQSDIRKLVTGGELVADLESEYDPTSFKSDYFLVNIDQTPSKEGTIIFCRDALNKLYINAPELNNIAPYILKSLNEMMISESFEYNYYKTIMLYAGCDYPVGTEDGYALIGPGVFDGKNIVYIQDVSQQKWEYNTDDVKELAAIGSREILEGSIYGLAYVVHAKGNTTASSSNEINFLYCLQDSQAAYWDTTTNSVKWAWIAAGKFYQVAFDNVHSTQRWLVTPTTKQGEIWATEYDNMTIASWETSGITFDSNKYCAEYVEDTTAKMGAKVRGAADKTFSRIFSGAPFVTAEEHHLEYVGRPNCYSLDTYTYYKDDVKYIEADGEYIWSSDVDGVQIQLLIPDNRDEAGVPHRDTYILRMNMSNLSSTETLYRHTFTITPYNELTWSENEYKAYLSFCAVNSQVGDSNIEYLLHSDETGQPADWILPVSGIIGKVGADGQVSKWYTAGRIIAGWYDVSSEYQARCLYIDYVDEEAGQFVKAPFITDDNKWKFYTRDFKSIIGQFKAPYSANIKE